MTNPPTRSLVAAACAAGLALLAWPAAAADLAEPETTTENGRTVLAVHADETSFTFLPQGEAATTEEPERPPTPGDGFGFTEDLLQDGVRVGSTKVRCTFTSVTETSGSQECDATLTFSDGTIRVLDDVEWSEDTEGQPDVLALAGGTGAYAGAKGTLTVTNQTDDGNSDLRLSFTTGSGQVEQTPAGGAETGGGAGDAAPVALFALGAAALGLGAGIAGLGRRVRRVPRP